MTDDFSWILERSQYDRDQIKAALPVGRANAISLQKLCSMLTPAPATSTVRGSIRNMQRRGVGVLSSPRAGVWMAADDGERLDVIDELRLSINAIEHRIADINQGRCALRSCRKELARPGRRRGGLYCCPEHRYKAAIDRGK